MPYIKFCNDLEPHKGTVKRISDNVVQVVLETPIPINTSGFTTYRDYTMREQFGVFTDYTTEYSSDFKLSNDGSVEPSNPDVPTPEPIEKTLEEVKLEKVTEMNNVQQQLIENGVNVTLTDGTVEHFTLTDKDQASLMGLQAKAMSGETLLPWHNSDQAEHCKYYSVEDMLTITDTALKYVTYHVTYFRDLRIYINSLETKEEVELIQYGVIIPPQYQSEVLADIYASMNNEQSI